MTLGLGPEIGIESSECTRGKAYSREENIMSKCMMLPRNHKQLSIPEAYVLK